ncbi:MAG: DUF2264 domain-containing protein [Rhodobacteraceae bacterium]|nr:DUF2264 domain-containing protein [Paracoccaceae bacterium]PHR53596.1 MAG: hypothetical protein COA47_16725 [Robiginitomaculum sp.]
MINPFENNALRTRDDLAQAVRDLVAPLVAHFSPGKARVRIGASGARHDEASADIEAFARPLWGIAPLAAGGYTFEHWDIWRTGLANGTNPDHAEYWGDPGDNDQRLVEMAAIGFALRLVPEHIWQPLSTEAKTQVAAYLTKAHRSCFANCNWKFFRLLIGLGLGHVGVRVDTALHDAYLDEIDEYYLSEGWYFDGKPKQADHYIPFAFHYYGLLYASLADDPARADTFRQRASEFAQDIGHWYADDGAALPFGRSLTYQFAHAGIWGALAFSDVPALPWGQIKGYYLRNLRWWARQPIFDASGLMNIGFAYPNLMMSEGYNGPGSPYWAMKAFLPLALAADHPFWAAEETVPAPSPEPVSLPQAAMIIQALPGHKVALTSGQELTYMRHGAEKYAKFAYSTRYGFSVEVDERQFWQATSDNMISFSDDGVHFRMRETNEVAQIADNCLYGRWRPYADVLVETWLVPVGHWHFRLHEVTTPRKLDSIEGGFAIARPANGSWQIEGEGGKVALRTAHDISTICGADHRKARSHLALPNSNVINARTVIPQLTGALPPGTTQLACAVLAMPLAALPPLPPFPTITSLRALFAAKGRQVMTK